MVQLKGFSECTAVLRQMPVEMQRTIIKSTITKCAMPLRNAARSEAPNRTGALRKNIKITSWKSASPSRVSIAVRPQFAGSGLRPYYGLWIEQGTKDHSPLNKKVMRFENAGKVIFARRVKGIKSNKYLERAWTIAGGNIDRTFADNLRIQIERYIAKHFTQI